jgi:tetratricopeptide (TPR) repeat protein
MSRPSRLEVEIEALLRRADRVRAIELLRLVHEINPTGLDLPPSVERRRYELKSRLQSRLVRDFPDEVSVMASPGEEGVVLLHHRPSDRDACHALVSELDDDARSFIRLRLDLDSAERHAGPVRGAESKERRPKAVPAFTRTTSPTEPRELVRSGREALDAFDYDRARECFEGAFSLSEGGAAEALALLGFLVDSLAAYPEALACGARLSPSAGNDGEVRALLAVAAIQAGDAAACRRFLDGAEGRDAAQAWTLLARAELQRDALPEVEACLARARELDPGLPDLLSLDADVARRRAEESRPLELGLERLLATGDEAGAEEQARSILHRWPGSAPARRVLREIEARKRMVLAAELVRQGHDASASGDFQLAAMTWRRAADMGVHGLEPSIVEALRADEARASARRVGDVQAALTASVTGDALTHYLSLASDERRLVRERTTSPELDWLEALRGGVAARDPALDVAAVLDLARAMSMAASMSPNALLALLAPHEARIRMIQAGRGLLDEAQRAQASAALRMAEQLGGEAASALAAGRLEDAIRLAEEALASAPHGIHGEAKRLLDDAHARLARQRRATRFGELIEAGRLFEALNLTRQADEDQGEVRESWRERRVDVTARIRKALCLEVVECPGGVDAPEYLDTWTSMDEVAFGLSSDGESLFWVMARGRHLFIRRTSASAQRVVTLVALHLPEPMDFPRVHVDGASLWVFGLPSAALEVSTETWDVLQWQGSPASGPEAEVVENHLVMPGGRFLWQSARPLGGSAETTRVFRLGQSRCDRVIKNCLTVELFPGEDGLRVFATGYERRGRICSPSGVVMVELPESVESIAALPGGGYLCITETVEEEGWLEVSLLGKDGALLNRLDTLEMDPDAGTAIATSFGSARSFLMGREAEGLRVEAYSVGSAAPEQVWRAVVPDRTCFAQDVGGVNVGLVWATEHGPAVGILGGNAPEIPALSRGAFHDVPGLGMDFCGSPPSRATADAEMELVRGAASDVARRRAVENAIERLHADPVALVQLASAMRLWRLQADAVQVATIARASFPGHPWVLMDEAETAVHEGEAARAIEALARMDTAALEPHGQAHLHHLRGVALYQLGRLDEACDEMKSVASVPDGRCKVSGWVPWLQFLSNPMETAPKDDASQLLLALWRADRSLASGDGGKAGEQLDTWRGWRWMGVQVGARLADAVLLQTSAGTLLRARKRLVLAAYLEERARRRLESGRTLPLGPMEWGEGKLADVEARARAWLVEILA